MRAEKVDMPKQQHRRLQAETKKKNRNEKEKILNNPA